MKTIIISLVVVILMLGMISAYDANSSVKVITPNMQNIRHFNGEDNMNNSIEDDGDNNMIIKNSTTRLQEMIRERVEHQNEMISEMKEKIRERGEHRNETIVRMRKGFLERRGFIMMSEIGNGSNNSNMFLERRGFMVIPEMHDKTDDNMTDDMIKEIQTRRMLREEHLFPIRTRLKLYNEDIIGNTSELKVKLSDGKNATIKIMPATAFKKALERLRMKNCNATLNNCTIELKEVGNGNDTNIVYEARAMKTFRLFGIFKMRRAIMAQINAETNKDVIVKMPWWSWMASEQDD